MYELFVSPQRVKRDSALGGSVDDDLIRPYIYLAQEKYILPVLGQSLYDDVSSEIASGTVSATYQTLLNDYVQFPLIHYAFSTIIPFLRVRFVNNAVTVMNSEQSSPASNEEIKPVIDASLSLANFAKERLIQHLWYNGTSLYPEFQQEEAQELRPSYRNYTANINISPIYTKQVESYLAAIGVKL